METFIIKTIEFLKGQSIQVAIVFIGVLILTWLLRNKSAHVRYLLWLLVAVKCLTPPLVIFSVPVLPAETVPVVIPAQSPTIEQTRRVAATDQRQVDGGHTESPIDLTTDSVAATGAEIEKSEPVPGKVKASKVRNPLTDFFHLNSTGVLLSLWVAGAALYLLQALGKAIRLQMRLKKIRKPLPPQLMIEQIEKLSQLWDYPGGFNVWLVDGITQPFVWGLWRGAIYLPTHFQSIQSDKQKAIVLHEMAHVVRLDAFINLIQILIQGVFWFHPLVWLANRAIRQEREKCCDEIAVARLGTAPREYGSAIVDTLLQEVQSSVTIPSLAVAGPVKNIEDRIKTIMQPGKRFFRRPSVMALLIIGLLAVITIPTTIALTHKVTPPDYMLGGKVTDVNDKPIAGAIVYDDGYGPEPYQKGITDEAGKFEYKSWNEEHNVTAKADGFQPQTQVFTTFPLDNSKNLNFKLQPGKQAAESTEAAPIKISFSKNVPLREALQMLGKAYKKNIILSDKITGEVPVTDLYDITSVEQALQAILGSNKYVIDGNFIRIYTAEEFAEIKSAILKKAQSILKNIEGCYSMALGAAKSNDTDTVIKTLETSLTQLGELEKTCGSVQIETAAFTALYRQVIELFKQGEKEKAQDMLDLLGKYGMSLEDTIQNELKSIHSEGLISRLANQKTDVEIEAPLATVPVEALSKQEKERLAAMGHIRQAALGCIMFADDNDGRLPEKLEQIKPYLKEDSVPLDKMELVSAVLKRTEIKNAAATALLQMLLNGGKDGAVVAYVDGHAEYFSPQRMKTADYPNSFNSPELKEQKPLSALSIPADASPRVTNALKTISDLMISLDAAEQRGETLSADVFNQINEQCDNLQGKNNVEMPDVAEWGKLPSRLIDILELLHKIEETAEGCRSLAQGNYPDMLKQHWQKLKDQYNTLCLFLQPKQTAEVKAETTKQNPQFTAALPDGMTVELVGLCEYPSQGKQWWSPNGSPLGYDITTKDSSHYEDKNKAYEIAYRISVPEGITVDMPKVKGSTAQSGLDVISPAGLKAIRTHLDLWSNTTTVSFPIAVGPWKTLGTTQGNGMIAVSVGNRKLLFSPAVGTKDIFTLTVTDDLQQFDNYRLIAVDKQQNKHTARRDWSSVDNTRQNTFTFTSLDPAAVDHYEFQSRPFINIEFENVSLKPGKKTDVIIEIPKELKADTTYEEAFQKAINVIHKQENWPQTPQAVVEAYWKARAKKDYNHTRVLWPASSLWDVQTYQNDLDVKYAFGAASSDGLEVPYAEENHYKQTGSYNLTMRLAGLDTAYGKRYYIRSGN